LRQGSSGGAFPGMCLLSRAPAGFPAHQEPKLLAFAYDLEQEIGGRPKPKFMGSLPPLPPDAGICGFSQQSAIRTWGAAPSRHRQTTSPAMMEVDWRYPGGDTSSIAGGSTTTKSGNCCGGPRFTSAHFGAWFFRSAVGEARTAKCRHWRSIALPGEYRYAPDS